MTIALVLGGGAPNLTLMAGAVAALDDAGVEFDVVSTSGAGMLIGLSYAAPKGRRGDIKLDRAAALKNTVNMGVHDAIYRFFPVNFKVFHKPGTLARAYTKFWQIAADNREAIAKLDMHDLEKILAATLSGMTVDAFRTEAAKWLAQAKDGRWKRPYTELTYQPMQEVLQYLRANGYKTYIVTGGGQDFVRVYAETTYGIPPEQVVGTAEGTSYSYDSSGRPILTKQPKLLLNDNNAGKPEGIHLMIGRRPYAAFGNSTGDRQMLEWTGAGAGARLKMLVLHDDAAREYAYGPAQGLPDSKVGTFTPALYEEAKKKGWTVISMKNDWRRVFPFDNEATEARP